MTQDALRYAGVPSRNAERVQQYYEYLQTRSHPGAEGMAFLGDLPAGLSSRLTRFLHTKDLCKLPIFQDCERGFIAALSNRMKMINMAPMESIFKVGDAGKEMFIIKKVRAKGGNGSWGACAYTWASSCTTGEVELWQDDLWQVWNHATCQEAIIHA